MAAVTLLVVGASIIAPTPGGGPLFHCWWLAVVLLLINCCRWEDDNFSLSRFCMARSDIVSFLSLVRSATQLRYLVGHAVKSSRMRVLRGPLVCARANVFIYQISHKARFAVLYGVFALCVCVKQALLFYDDDTYVCLSCRTQFDR